MNMVYILLAHTNAKQVIRLIDRLNTPHTRFVIHISINCEPGTYDALQSATKEYQNVAFAKRTSVKWGNFDVIQALLNCLELICTQNYDYDRAYILSGQDYPLQSNDVIEQTLSRYNGQQIMEYFPLPDDSHGHSKNRWMYYYFRFGKRHMHLPIIHPENFLMRIASRLIALILPVRMIPSNLQPYGGSFWSSLSPQAVTYLHNLSNSPEGKKAIRFFKFNLHPGEMFLQTMLLNSPLKNTINNLNLHYIKFPPDSGHPIFFTVNDFEELNKAKELFARKIDDRIDNNILNMLDEKIQAE